MQTGSTHIISWPEVCTNTYQSNSAYRPLDPWSISNHRRLVWLHPRSYNIREILKNKSIRIFLDFRKPFSWFLARVFWRRCSLRPRPPVLYRLHREWRVKRQKMGNTHFRVWLEYIRVKEWLRVLRFRFANMCLLWKPFLLQQIYDTMSMLLD